MNKTKILIASLIIILSLGIVSIIFLYNQKYFKDDKQESKENYNLNTDNLNNTSPTPTIDNKPLQILNKQSIKKEVETFSKNYSFFILTNKKIQLDKNNSFTNLYEVGNNAYVIELIQLVDGENEFNVKIKDEINNQEEIQIKVKKNKSREIKDWPNFKYSDITRNLKIIVDKQNKLPSSYEPEDLVDIGAYPYSLYINKPNLKLRKEAADQLKLMLDDYYKTFKKNLVIASAYRSYNDQYNLHSYWLNQLGEEEAIKISARPGYSEHQLGTTVDFIDEESGYQLTEKFAQSKSYKWLQENAYKYGFALSYPQNKEDITGYKFEPWHWRYIGVELAKKFSQQNELTLNKWLENN